MEDFTRKVTRTKSIIEEIGMKTEKKKIVNKSENLFYDLAETIQAMYIETRCVKPISVLLHKEHDPMI